MPITKNIINLAKMILVVSISLPMILSIAFAGQCPAPNSIKRNTGEFSWRTWHKGWVGYFLSPEKASGHSYQVVGFRGAKWMQLSDLKHSPGYIICNYDGDFAGEIIQFIQNQATSVYQPPYGKYWNCGRPTSFPQIACKCHSSNPKDCAFD